MYTMEYYSAIKKNGNLTFTATWMKLDGIMLSAISQSERQILYDITYMWNLDNKASEYNKKIQTHRYKNKLVGREKGGGAREEGQDEGEGSRGTNYYA